MTTNETPPQTSQPEAQKEAPKAPVRRRRARLDLPFGTRKEDAGEWTYRHRIGLCVTLIAYLVLMIGFVSGKIVIGSRNHTQGMFIDLNELAALEDERDRLQEEIRRKMQENLDWRQIQNQTSNEHATDERLKDDRGTNTQALNADAAAAAERMRANREAYEQGLAAEEAMRQERGTEKGEEKATDKRVKGRVTVSFSLKNPTRYSRDLVIPAYLCEAGGDVEVSITVNRAGEVIAARVVSGGDDCMRETAIEAARRSTFNIDNSAPERQTGTISYIFIPQ